MKSILAFAIIVIAALPCEAQKKKRSAPFNAASRDDNSKFLDKQWWLGLKAGINLTQAIPEARYTVLTPTNYPASATDKRYDAYRKAGGHATLEVTFSFRGIAISAQPTYRTSRFTYHNQQEWTNPENSAEHLTLMFDHEQRIDYADFPLIAKYEFMGNNLRPYVQAGAFYSVLVNAVKSLEVSGTDFASGGTNPFSSEPVIVGAKDLFDNSWGLLLGTGVNYNLGNVRLVLDISYRHGMSNAANVKNRFSNDRLSGIGDAQDDVRLNNLVFSMGCLFPMRFLTSDYKSLH